MLGILFIILSSLIYGIEPSILELALREGVTAAEATASYGLVVTLFSFILVLVRKSPIKIPFRQVLKLAALGAIGQGGTGILLSLAYRYIPVGCATVLHYMYPTFVCLLTALLFGSKIGGRRIAAILLSLSGLFCIALDELAVSAAGIGLAVASGLTYSTYVVALDKSAVSRTRMETKILYLSLGGMLFSFLIAAFQQPSGAINLQTGGTLLSCGLMMFVAGLLFIVGLSRIGGTSASFLSLLEPITSMVFSLFLYHYALPGTTILGCVLSLGAITMIFLADRHDAKTSEPG